MAAEHAISGGGQQTRRDSGGRDVGAARDHRAIEPALTVNVVAPAFQGSRETRGRLHRRTCSTRSATPTTRMYSA